MPLNNAPSIGRDMGVLLSCTSSAVDLPELDHVLEWADSECGTPSARYDASVELDNIAGSVSDSSDYGGDDDILRKLAIGADDDHGEREYTGCFEGPEKTLEVRFKRDVGKPKGCRALTRLSLDSICSRARCKILHEISNDYLDAYLLSESSLFVYSHKVIMKTCGTTTLLHCVATILQEALEQQGLVLEWMSYSRKNFTFPGDQLFPHSSFDQELQYLRTPSHLSQQLDGAGYVLGPVTGDHWFAYVADKCNRRHSTGTDRTMNMMMFDMHPDTASKFYKEACPTAQAMTKETGIDELVPGAVVDDFAFDPCGYSMNAIQYDSYYTIHVTPEESCSYASFETNHPFKSYRSIINNVLNIFRPKRWVLTMVADKAGLSTFTESPFKVEQMDLPLHEAHYVRTSVSSTVVEGDCVCVMGAWDTGHERQGCQQEALGAPAERALGLNPGPTICRRQQDAT